MHYAMAERDTSPLTTSEARCRRLIDVSQSPDREWSTEPPGVDMTIPLTLSHIIHAVTSGAASAAEILLHLTPEHRHNAEIAAYRLGYCAARTSGSRSPCAPPPRTSSIWLTPMAPSTIGASPRASSRPAIRSDHHEQQPISMGLRHRIAPRTRRGGSDSGVGAFDVDASAQDGGLCPARYAVGDH
jgi:hypothetical protein